jgi:uncharacterized protein YfdQ (DUF2303 family)
MDMTRDALQLLLDAGATSRLMVDHNLDADPFTVVPNHFKAEDLSRFFPPNRIKSTVTLTTPASFVEYVNRFKDIDSLIFAKVTDTMGVFKAVLDYHRMAGSITPARRCEHRAVYVVEITTEWNRWNTANGKRMAQEEFAIWLEENQDMLVLPTGAELLELVQTLEGKNHVQITSAVRLRDGRFGLNYDEDVELKGGVVTSQSGAMELPAIIEAGISPFHGVEKYRIRARLKYRIESRKVNFWFETISPHVVIRDALQGVCNFISEKTEVPLLLGELL